MSGCAIPGCTDPCRSRQLMCRWHWKKVPAKLKAAVLARWNEMQASETAPEQSEARLKARLAVIRQYREAKDAAVADVCQQEGISNVS